MKFIKSIPIAFCSLSLALATLGNLLLVPYGETVRYICGALSTLLLIIFALKVTLDFPHVRAELKTPVPLSVLPNATMTLMLLSVYLKPFANDVATCLWYAAVLAHLGIMALFVKRFVLNFKLENVFPSWFIPSVGIITASVTAPVMDALLIGQAAFCLGFVLYLATLPLVICRMIKRKAMLEPLKLTTAIFTAPMSLSIVGYFNVFEQKSEILVYTMLIAAVAIYLYVSVKMVSLLRVKFYPTYVAFTFPYVISAIAFRIGNGFLIERGMSFFAPFATLSMWIAIALVIYVLAHYVRYFWFWLKF